MKNKFTVFFDGACKVCRAEIDFYRTKQSTHAIEWVDLSSKEFRADSVNISPEELNRVFHVRDEEGRWITGVDAFIEIWKRIPSLRNWVTLSRLPGARTSMKLGYRLFVRIRPYLPRHESDCADGSCARVAKI